MIPNLEFHLLGTGTSSAVPAVHCLTSPSKGCYCCRSTIDAVEGTDEYRNKRRNTSAIIRVPGKGGEDDLGGKTILIDCGKTFYSAALEWWPKKGLRRIDALLITHAHADAFLGLDDLRGWTLHGSIQKSIKIYCTQETFDEISRCFPYLADSSKATGGGDVPAFEWIIFDPLKPLDIIGIEIIPLPVHHGKHFVTPPQPYICYGFLIDRRIAYISDVSFIPDATWSTLEKYVQLSDDTSSSSSEATLEMNGLSLNGKEKKPRLQLLVVDTLRITSFVSHFGLSDAILTARRLSAVRTYLVGFAHSTSHSTWRKTLERISNGERTKFNIDENVKAPTPTSHWLAQSGTDRPGQEDPEMHAQWGMFIVESGDLKNAGKELWIRPGCDGLTITLGGEGGNGFRDDVYD